MLVTSLVGRYRAGDDNDLAVQINDNHRLRHITGGDRLLLMENGGRLDFALFSSVFAT